MSWETSRIVTGSQARGRQFKPTGSSTRSNNTQVEDRKDHQPLVGIKLTGYRLLNVTVILSFGVLKAVSSYQGQSVVPTALDLVVGIGLAAISYRVGLLRDDYPEIYPLFFQVDLVPSILKFLFRSEVYFYFLSLLPLWQAVSLVYFALDIRQRVQLGDQKFSTSITVRNLLATAVVELLLTIVATLRQLAKVARLQVLHHLVAHEIVSLSLTAVSLVILFYLLIYVAITIIKEQYDMTYVPGMDLLSILSSFVLLESMSGKLKGLYFRIWAFLILLLMGLLSGSRISLLFLSGIVIPVLYRFSATFWRSFVVSVREIS